MATRLSDAQATEVKRTLLSANMYAVSVMNKLNKMDAGDSLTYEDLHMMRSALHEALHNIKSANDIVNSCEE